METNNNLKEESLKEKNSLYVGKEIYIRENVGKVVKRTIEAIYWEDFPSYNLPTRKYEQRCVLELKPTQEEHERTGLTMQIIAVGSTQIFNSVKEAINAPLTLKEFLLYRTRSNTEVHFYEEGYLTGMTYVDSEDLFIGSLDNIYLNYYVKDYSMITDKFGDVFLYYNVNISHLPCPYNGLIKNEQK